MGAAGAPRTRGKVISTEQDQHSLEYPPIPPPKGWPREHEGTAGQECNERLLEPGISAIWGEVLSRETRKGDEGLRLSVRTGDPGQRRS